MPGDQASLNAEANLKAFARELNLTLYFDENDTCILGIDNAFSLHITRQRQSRRLFLYSPLLDGLPKDPLVLKQLYEDLLQGSMLGAQMAGGGVGIALKEGLVLIHGWLDMTNADSNALKNYAPFFVEATEKWRDRCEMIRSGKTPPPFQEQTSNKTSTIAKLTNQEIDSWLAEAEQGKLSMPHIMRLEKNLPYLPSEFEAKKASALLMMQCILQGDLDKALAILLSMQINIDDPCHLLGGGIFSVYLSASVAILEFIKQTTMDIPDIKKCQKLFQNTADQFAVNQTQPTCLFFVIFMVFRRLCTLLGDPTQEDLSANKGRIDMVTRWLEEKHADTPHRYWMTLVKILNYLNIIALSRFLSESDPVDSYIQEIRELYKQLSHNYFSSDHFFLKIIEEVLLKFDHPQQFPYTIIVTPVTDETAQSEQLLETFTKLITHENGDINQAAEYSKKIIELLLAQQKTLEATEIFKEVLSRYLSHDPPNFGEAETYLKSIFDLWAAQPSPQRHMQSAFAQYLLTDLCTVSSNDELITLAREQLEELLTPPEEESKTPLTIEALTSSPSKRRKRSLSLHSQASPSSSSSRAATPTLPSPIQPSDGDTEEDSAYFLRAKQLCAAKTENFNLLRCVFIPYSAELDEGEKCQAFSEQFTNLSTLQESLEENVCFLAKHPTLDDHYLIGFLLSDKNLLLIDPQGGDCLPKDFQECCEKLANTHHLHLFFSSTNLLAPLENLEAQPNDLPLTIAISIMQAILDDEKKWAHFAQQAPAAASSSQGAPHVFLDITDQLPPLLRKLILSSGKNLLAVVIQELQNAQDAQLETWQDALSTEEQALLEKMLLEPEDLRNILPALTKIQRERQKHKQYAITKATEPALVAASIPPCAGFSSLLHRVVQPNVAADPRMRSGFLNTLGGGEEDYLATLRGGN